MLTSIQNPRVKLAKRLREAKGRRQEGLFLIEGSKLVAEALAWKWPLDAIFATPDWLETAQPLWRDKAEEAAPHVLAGMGTLDSTDGVLAFARLPEIQELPAVSPDSLWVVADRIQDPGNLGGFVRTADAAGADAIVVGPGTADPFGPKAVRASMGSLFHLPIVATDDVEGVRTASNAAGMRWIATLPRDGKSIYEANLTGPVAWWVGNESKGLDPECVARADLRVFIPMPGRAESLNAGAALAVCLFETGRQRRVQRDTGR